MPAKKFYRHALGGEPIYTTVAEIPRLVEEYRQRYLSKKYATEEDFRNRYPISYYEQNNKYFNWDALQKCSIYNNHSTQ